MGNNLPILFIILGVISIVIALLVWHKKTKETISPKRVGLAQWITGITLAVVGALFIVDGDVIGENTVDVATLIGFIGIALMATAKTDLLTLKRKSPE